MVAIAASQYGVISLAQLVECGLSASGVRNWVATRRLHRVHRGVFAVGRADLTMKGRFMAAVLACGEGAVLSHAAAAALQGMRASSASCVDVTVSRLVRRGRIRAHRARLHPSDVTVIDGIPCTTVARTLLDLAATHRDAQVERAAHQAVVNEDFDMRAMSKLLARSHGYRGIRRLRAVLARGDLGANVPASGLEVHYRDLCARAGLPKPELNRYILLGDEYHLVDFLWRAERVVIETDGARYHASGWQRRRDRCRDELLDTHGWYRARLPEDEIEHRPARAVAVARELLARSSRGRAFRNVA